MKSKYRDDAKTAITDVVEDTINDIESDVDEVFGECESLLSKVGDLAVKLY